MTQAQVRIVKDDLTNVHSLITEDVFQMIDNLSQALTERDNEVLELKKMGKAQEAELEFFKEA